MGFRNAFMMHIHDHFTRASSVKATDLWGTKGSGDDMMLSLDAALGFRADDDDPPPRTADVPKGLGAPKIVAAAPTAKRARLATPLHMAKCTSAGPRLVSN